MSDLPQIYRVLLTHFFDKNCWQNYNEIKTASKISHFRIFFLHFYLFPSFNFLLWGNFHFSGVKNESEQKILGIKGTFFHFQLDRSWLLSQLFLLFIGNICKYLVMKTANHLTIQIFLFLSFCLEAEMLSSSFLYPIFFLFFVSYATNFDSKRWNKFC